jgi:glucosyl-dolichyl phosphate glucuronosyltransferase
MSSMNVSVIIPTYNRSKSLKRLLHSLKHLEFPTEKYEVIIVDNNSSDGTKEVADNFFQKNNINHQYIKEDRLSFTVARRTGATYAKGEILVYIDDDVTVEKNWLCSISETFETDNAIGIVGGPIKPVYERKPPQWVLRMNGIWLSLFDLGDKEKETGGIPGPNFAIRKSVFEQVKGFPPDTIGVEAEGKPGVVEKIYVGPGDWGLCEKVIKAGYRIFYQPKAIVYHHIPPVRLTQKWWQSRFFGEGCLQVLKDQYEHDYHKAEIIIKLIKPIVQLIKWLVILFVCNVFKIKRKEIHRFWLWYYYAQLKGWMGVFRYPQMAKKLWNFGLSGVLPEQENELTTYSRWLK